MAPQQTTFESVFLFYFYIKNTQREAYELTLRFELAQLQASECEKE